MSLICWTEVHAYIHIFIYTYEYAFEIYRGIQLCFDKGKPMIAASCVWVKIACVNFTQQT